MDLREAEQLAIRLMFQYGVYQHDWKFAWDTKPRHRFGQTRYYQREIGLSVIPTRERPANEVENTIRHEIAHALVYIETGQNHGHDKVWQAMAVRVGAQPKATSKTVAKIKAKWEATCKSCGSTYKRNRMTAQARRGTACTKCCRQHNSGRYSERFRITYVQNW